MATWDNIIEEVTTKRRVGAKDIKGTSHAPHIVAARHEVCFRARTEIVVRGRPLSLHEIGRRLSKHHTTVLYGIRAVASAAP